MHAEGKYLRVVSENLSGSISLVNIEISNQDPAGKSLF